MKVIVDANIVFSAILNTDGRIGDLLLNSEGIINYISLRYMYDEVKKYYPKIQQISGKALLTIEKIHFKIMKNIFLISEDQIPVEFWLQAYNISKNIDPKDTPYVAASQYLSLKIWTGDKNLIKGLNKKNYHITQTTMQLFSYREEVKKNKLLIGFVIGTKQHTKQNLQATKTQRLKDSQSVDAGSYEPS